MMNMKRSSVLATVTGVECVTDTVSRESEQGTLCPQSVARRCGKTGTRNGVSVPGAGVSDPRLQVFDTGTGLLMVVVMLVLLAATPAKAQEGYAGQAGAFLRMGSGAAAVAMGDAGVARAMGAEQSHYNAAGLPYAPANDVYVGYHVLSLDRSLAHVGVLLQVPEISFWKDPIRPVALFEEEGKAPRLIDETDLPPTRKREIIDVDDYLEPLADAILTLAHSELDEIPSLELNGRTVQPGVLERVLTQMAAVARQENLTTPDQVLARMQTSYKRIQSKPAAVSLNWTHAGTKDIEGRNLNGQLYDTFGFYENRFSFSFGLRLHRMVSAGVTVGVLYATVPELMDDGSALTSTTFGADAGLQLRPFAERELPYGLETFTVGLAGYDIGGKNSWNTTGYWEQGTTKTDEFPDRYRAGFAYAPVNGVTFAADLETDLDAVSRVKAGAEVYVIGSERFDAPNGGPFDGEMTRDVPTQPALILRAGMDDDSPTFGLGLVLHVMGLGLTRLDYAYVVEEVSPEPTQVLTWRFRFAI